MPSGWGPFFDFHGAGLHFIAINAVLMFNGSVLMWPRNPAADDPNTHSTRAYVWNPLSNTPPEPAMNMLNDMFCSGMSQLPDGRILVAGGHIRDNVGTMNASIFNPVNRSWIRADYMDAARWYPTVTTLPSGQLLVTSGISSPSLGFANTPEIYDMKSNRWTPLPSAFLVQAWYPFTFVLPDGNVFWAGSGATNANGTQSRILNTTTWRWGPIKSSAVAGLMYGSAVMYEPGKILKSGGKPRYPGVPDDDQFAVATCDMIDLNKPNPTWVSKIPGKSVPSMHRARWMHNMTILPDGTVFCSGGTNRRIEGRIPQRSGDSDWTDAELFKPGTDADGQPTGTWVTLPGNATRPRWYHMTQLLLPDGSILTAGSNNSGVHDQENAQIYYPPYFDLITAVLPQPQITAAPSGVRYGTEFSISRDGNFANVASKAALMGLGSVTHSFDMNQRLVWLDFNPATGRVQAPASSNLAPPGYYMLFLLDRRGPASTLVPSKSVMIKISESPASPTRPSQDVLTTMR